MFSIEMSMMRNRHGTQTSDVDIGFGSILIRFGYP